MIVKVALVAQWFSGVGVVQFSRATFIALMFGGQ
jgi:hypothetical protein